MKKILVVEDDAIIRRGMVFILKNSGFEPVEANSVAEGRELYMDCVLCLLDLMLPDGSGMDLCREIRTRSNVPIIFLTCVDDNDRIAHALDLGADDYVTKPFDSKVLMSRVNAVLRRAGVGTDGDDEQIADLTDIERRLMAYLRLNKNRILTREQILEALWDSKGDFVNDNTLSVRINRLRSKLERSGSAGHIQTVKGVGYKWTE